MIRLGLRLTVAGGREALARLVITAVAVTIGTGLLLATLAGVNAVNAQNARYAWLATGAVRGTLATASTPDPLLGRLSTDLFKGQNITRVDVAGTGPRSPVPPGIPRLPGPGQYYASPALAKLLRSTPADQLADRYDGRLIGTIGAAALPAPNSLIVVVGHTANELEHQGAVKVARINTVMPIQCNNCPPNVGINANGMDLILAIVAGAMLFPILILIGSATRLSAARREQRFAAMRLVGATPRQISTISAVESSVGAAIGVGSGFVLFYALRATIARIPFAGAPFYPGDLSLHPLEMLLVAVGVPLAAAVVALLALRRVRVSPLGVSRRVTPKPPSPWRLVVLVLGIVELGYFLWGSHPNTGTGQVAVYLPGFLIIMTGLVVAGPWFTMLGARIMARRAQRPDVLVAARRLADNPKAGFRAISGLVLALFVTTAAVAVITTVVARDGTPESGPSAAATVVKEFGLDFVADHRPGSAAPTDAVPDSEVAELSSIPGVHAVLLIRSDPDSTSDRYPPQGLVSCVDLARMPSRGRCPAGGTVVTISTDFRRTSDAGVVWPKATIPVAQLRQLSVQSLVVTTNGTTQATERVRTVLEQADSAQNAPYTIGEQQRQSNRQILQYRQLADVVILVSLLIAGCSLAVSVAGGLNERKRPFSLLRLTGVPLAVLRRVVALESAVPLLASAVVSIGAALLAAQLFLRSQLHYSLQPLGVEYYVVVVVGIAASLAIIASMLPLLDRLTGPEAARND
jgi:FtsX-like permease family protein